MDKSNGSHQGQSHVANNARSNRVYQAKPTDPDEYLPLKLEADQLPQSIKALANIFPHVWPIKAPGDDRINRVHSPLQAMLQSPLSRSQQEKQADKLIKGAKPVRVSKDWTDKRTSVIEYVTKPADLLESEYVLHPTCWQTAGLSYDREIERRGLEKQTTADGWVDTNISKLEDGMVPEKDIEQGSMTGGRKILSMDCEMCTVKGGSPALTRISLVDWGGDIVMDEFVQPDSPIIDYLTQ